MAISNAGRDATPVQVEMRADLRARLEAELQPGERILHQLVSDMSLDGTFSDECWLVVTADRVLAFDPAHPGGFAAVRIDELKAVDLVQLYGNALIQLSRSTSMIQIIRFSKTLEEDFEKAAESLKGMIPGADPEQGAHAHHHEAEERCAKCGRKVTTGARICFQCMNKRDLLGRSFAYMAKYRFAFIMSFVLTLALMAISLLPQILTGTLLDQVIRPTDTGVTFSARSNMLWLLLGALAVSYLVSAGLQVAQLWISQWLGNKVIVDLRTEVFQHLQKLQMTFYDKRQTGWIMSRVTGDTSYLQQFMVGGIQNIASQFLLLFSIAIFMFAVNWKLALVALVPTPFVGYFTTRFSQRMHKMWHRIWRRVSGMQAMLGDTIPGIRVVKAFTQEDYEVGRFVQKNEEVFEENMKAVRSSAVFYPTVGFITGLGGLLVWLYGGLAVLHETPGYTAGTVIVFIGFANRFYQPIQMLSQLAQQVQQAVTAAERLFEILDTEPEVSPQKQGKRLERLRGEIEFKHVSFYYEKGDPALLDINYHIAPGQMIGLVGPSGSGKTTVINLISRFYEITGGELLVDGVPIDDLDLSWWRDQIGLVLQDPFLFHGTIAENIAYGKQGASFEEIVQAAMMANAHGFIMDLPDGYDTRIGERGVGLSGGERQRISIARAILKNPRILILDEATSAVDTETEKLIQEAIDRLTDGRTTLAIAHRLSTLQNADRLMVLQDGKLVESGTHAELLAKPDGVFAKLVKMQTEIAQSRVHLA
ncbi:MAG TPA: ABC transporter ATP-binding protein [Limnochordia bacterium]|nr:ABC transporter ATP-binding protein [Limnochordia bacterium]